MTQIDEPNLDEQLERIASIACGAELGLLDDEIVDEDIKRMNATTRANKDRLKKSIKALIATQIQEAYKKGYIDGGIGVMNGELPFKRRFVSKEELAKEMEATQ